MRFLQDDTPDVVLVFWIGVCVFVLALIIFLTIIGMRWSAKRRERRHLRDLRRWRELLEKISKGESLALPALSTRNAPEFLEAWNDIHDELPNAGELLRGVGEQVGLSATARRMLDDSHHERALAIIALGHQGDQRDFESLVPLLSDASPIISLCAARALSQIDPTKAVELFVPAIVEHENWPDGAVARILKESNSESAATALSGALLRANDSTAAKLVRFLADTDAQRAAPIIRRLLDSKVDDHVISTCLQVISDRADADRVRGLLAHPRWHVRMHAASALGRLGDGSDQARLSALLSDSQWWVRYRAAQALSALAGEQGGMGRTQQDRFAQEIIQHVLAEPLRKGTT
ncbi:HEAT repeat domain-containing protein [Comamonas guangdongensis]|uniref:HEAT repeat domain-containing protein n=1 Tax=Comamonas guangdongensis TaxID=510515 RepID=A0ABV3ZZF0_9BURK